MVSSIQGLGSVFSSMGTSMKMTELTDDQKSTISDILSNYDPDTVTEEDAKEIFQAFKDAGINPAKGMKEAIEAAGFDAEQLRTWGMGDTSSTSGSSEMQGSMPPPPPPEAPATARARP